MFCELRDKSQGETNTFRYVCKLHNIHIKFLGSYYYDIDIPWHKKRLIKQYCYINN